MPIPLLVGIGQRRFGHRLPKPQVIPRLGLRVEARRNIPQTFAPGQLGKGHANELLTTAEMPHPRLGVVSFDQPVEGLAMHKIENLRQDVTAGIHRPKSCLGTLGNSNASHPFYFASA